MAAQDDEAADPGRSGSPAAARPRRGGHRRVVAPATRPEADPSDETPERPDAGPARDGRRPDAREEWILEQRPPHWD
ncbi:MULTISPECIES: hypothetical protein [unclassified Serinicoccus]|uniref:hypothetical protein n=1 Tax=unclassified Serinicoccus TaxID=2643101 RepID=UPI003851DFC9